MQGGLCWAAYMSYFSVLKESRKIVRGNHIRNLGKGKEKQQHKKRSLVFMFCGENTTFFPEFIVSDFCCFCGSLLEILRF